MNAEELRNLAESYYYDVYDVDYEVIDEELTGSRLARAKELMAKNPYSTLLRNITGNVEGSFTSSPGNQNRELGGTLDFKGPRGRGGRGYKGGPKTVGQSYSLDRPASNRTSQSVLKSIRRHEKKTQRESYDLYDIVLDYLLSEGMCDTVHNAENVMVNMSEEWIGAILDEVLRPKNIGYGMHDDDDRERGTTHDPETGHKEYDPFHPQNIKASTPQAKKIKDRLQKMITSQNPGTRARGRALHAHLINPDTPFASHEKAVRNRVRGENK